MRWPRTLRRRRAVEEGVKATIATAAVKAQALSLVSDLRETLDDLDVILRTEGTIDQTGATDPEIEEEPPSGR